MYDDELIIESHISMAVSVTFSPVVVKLYLHAVQ